MNILNFEEKWYEDKNIGIFFSTIPHVEITTILPSMTCEEKKEIAAKPFLNKTPLRVKLCDYKKNSTYSFKIDKGYRWDGASIPRFFWRLIGSKTDPKFLVPSMIHDILCEHHEYVNNDRYFADKVFERLLYVSGVPALNRFLMFHSVDNFQKVCGKW